jgi:hypothetical protein
MSNKTASSTMNTEDGDVGRITGMITINFHYDIIMNNKTASSTVNTEDGTVRG